MQKKEQTPLYLWYIHNRAQRKTSATRVVNLIPCRVDYLTIQCLLTRKKNWWHARCVHFMSKLLIYKQLRLSYSKLSVLIFAAFQLFMFWFNTDFVKWKSQFRNSLFDLKWSKNIFHFSNLIKALKKEKGKKSFWLYLN